MVIEMVKHPETKFEVVPNALSFQSGELGSELTNSIRSHSDKDGHVIIRSSGQMMVK
jgi:predicted class III extradiol MEMO1 family dioxygenase